MKKITLIRHAESIYNKTMDNSLINCGLTDEGKIQSSKLEYNFDLIIVSPLKRALDTLKYSNITYKNLEISDLFREYKTNGCDYFENEAIISETEEELYSRIKQAKQYISTLNQSNIGVVTHGDFIWWFTSKK